MDLMRLVAAGEAATGLALMLFPQMVVRYLFGTETAGAGLAVARIAGMALTGLGIACWPDVVKGTGARRSRIAMLAYSALATVYLGLLAIDGELRGPLQWPAVVVHLAVTVWLATARSFARNP
jgi:hypothetical protein